MKLKAFLFALTSAALFACSNSASNKGNGENDSATGDEEVLTVPEIEEGFPALFDSLRKADPNFSAENFEGGEAANRLDSLYHPIDTAALSPFYPYLIFNEDSSYALDMVSRNYVLVTKTNGVSLEPGSPDFQIGLIDMKNKRRKRLLFFGTNGGIFDARWENKNALVMAGTNEVVGSDSLRPVLWRFEEPTKSWQVFPYAHMVPGDWHKYLKKWK